MPLKSIRKALLAFPISSVSSETSADFCARVFMSPPYSAFTSAMVVSRAIDGLIDAETKRLLMYLPLAAGGFPLRTAVITAKALSRAASGDDLIFPTGHWMIQP